MCELTKTAPTSSVIIFRSPLSSLHSWSGQKRSLYYEGVDYYCDAEDLEKRDEGGVAWLGGRKVVDMNASLKRLRLDDSSVVYYDKACSSFSFTSSFSLASGPPHIGFLSCAGVRRPQP